MKNKRKNKWLKGCLIAFAIFFITFFIAPLISLAFLPDTIKDAKHDFINQNYNSSLTTVNSLLENDEKNKDLLFLKYKSLIKINDSISSDSTLRILRKQYVEKDSLLQFYFSISEWKKQEKDSSEFIAYSDSVVTNLNFQDKLKLDDVLTLSDGYYSFNNRKKSDELFRVIIDSLYEIKDTTYVINSLYKIRDKNLDLNDTILVESIEKKLIERYNDKSTISKYITKYWNAKDYKSAKYYLKKHPDLESSPKLLNQLAYCYHQLKSKRNAIKFYKKSFALGDKEACENLRELTAKTRYYYKTQCCDGSTSNATGRGACSHHGGVCGRVAIPYKDYSNKYNCY